MPFYAGWESRAMFTCKRRTAKRSVEEIFAAAYDLYTRYYIMRTKNVHRIFAYWIHEIVHQRSMKQHNSSSHHSKKGFSHWGFAYSSFDILFRYCFPRTEFKVVLCSWCNRKWHKQCQLSSQAYNIFRSALEQERYDGIIVTLGEVDALLIPSGKEHTHIKHR